jgi:hypothetical protein
VKNGAVELPVPIVNERQSAHLKVSGTVREGGYRLVHDHLMFEGIVHGPRNTLLLPIGWEVSAVSQPATVGSYQGRSFIALVSIQNEESSHVLVQARKAK